MKSKKFLAVLLLATISVGTVQVPVWANLQQPLDSDGILGIHISNEKTEHETIPSVKVEWREPKENNPGSSNSSDPYDHAGTHKLEYYQMELQNVLFDGKNVLSSKIDKNSTVEYIEDCFGAQNELQSGTLYKVDVLAQHDHKTAIDNGVVSTPAGHESKPNSEKYFLTDFNTKAQDSDGKLEVSWEYVPGAKYEVYYAKGDFATAQEVLSANPNKVTITDVDAGKNTYTEEDRKRTRVIIDETTEGQIYSAFVKVVDIKHANVSAPMRDIYTNTKLDEDGPKVAKTTTKIPLQVFNVGSSKIRLEWKIPSWMVLGNKLVETVIYERPQGASSYHEIGKMNNAEMNGNYPNYFEYRENPSPSEYYVEFKTKGTAAGEYLYTTTTEFMYIPHKLQESPTSPTIPKPYNKDIVVTENTKKEYLVQGDDIHSSSPLFINNTFHARTSSEGRHEVQLVWGSQNNSDGDVDLDLTYDIWVTDSIKGLTDESDPVIVDFSPENSQAETIHRGDGQTVVGFKAILSRYRNVLGEELSLQPNKTYYIKIVANRHYGDTKVSSLPTITMMTFDKSGDIFAPPVLSKPPLETKDVTEDSFTLEWSSEWYEIVSRKPEKYPQEEQKEAREWNHTLYFSQAAPYIRFKEQEGSSFIELVKERDVLKLEDLVNKAAGSETYFDENYLGRKTSLGQSVNYELKVVRYEDYYGELEKYNQATGSKLSIEQFIEKFETDSVDGWNSIEPVENETIEGVFENYKIEGLEDNTRYIAMLKAYNVVEGVKHYQIYPTFIMETTKATNVDPDVVPKVPELYLEDKGDTWASVKWKYNSDFEYEVRYGTTEDIGKSTEYPIVISEDPTDVNYVANGEYIVRTLEGLFPETRYYVWIKAKQKNGDKESAWSNPVEFKTDMLGAPNYPKGLGIASKLTISNLELMIDPLTKDSITIEWVDQYENIEDEMAKKEYIYIVEFANNEDFSDSKTIQIEDGSIGSSEDGINILDKNVVQFTGLDSNKEYFFRVKTQLKYTNSLIDKEIVVTSEYSPSIGITTNKSDDEYDGGIYDHIVQYEEDVVESFENGVWTMDVINSNALINKILNTNASYYKINLKKYKGTMDASVRKLQLPRSVVDALVNQNMTIRIETSKGLYDIPARNLKPLILGLGSKEDVLVNIYSITQDNHPMLQYPYVFMHGEKIELQNSQGKRLLSVDSPIRISLKSNNVDKVLAGYSFEGMQWNEKSRAIEENDISFETKAVGSYAIFERSQNAPISNMSYEMLEVSKVINSPELGVEYVRYDEIEAAEFVNLMLGLAENKSTILLGKSPSNSDFEKAKVTNIYISSNRGMLTREQVINGIVRVYELRNQTIVQTSENAPVGTSPVYKKSAAKAIELGLIERKTNMSEFVTLEEVYRYVFNII